MKKAYLLFIVLAAAFLTGCQSKPTVHTDYLKETPFQEFHSYTFVQDLSGKDMPAPIGPNMIKAMQNAVKERMSALQYAEVATAAEADIIVHIKAEIIRVEDEGPRFSIGFGVARGSGAYGLGYDPSDRDRDERTLLVDIYKADNKELIWRGYTQKQFFIHPKMKPEEVKLHIAEILASFPPSEESK
ncbi:MAG: DUF4136 domain-containing protein [Opitutales bacterium]|nr:DUF4136 domain-containing protein [Opitutales bacterium]